MQTHTHTSTQTEALHMPCSSSAAVEQTTNEMTKTALLVWPVAVNFCGLETDQSFRTSGLYRREGDDPFGWLHGSFEKGPRA